LLKPVLILCLGNEVLSDDGFGAEVARRLIEAGGLGEEIEALFAPLAGFNLLDLLQARRRVLIVDTICTGKAPPGTLHLFSADILVPSRNLTTSHQISLPTALELGRRMGMLMPERIDVLAVEAEDVTTLSETMTPRVSQAVSEAVDQIRIWIDGIYVVSSCR